MGERGIEGGIGNRGPKGEKGDMGEKGVMGDTGPTGESFFTVCLITYKILVCLMDVACNFMCVCTNTCIVMKKHFSLFA